MRVIQTWTVDAAIYSGIDDAPVWEGRIDVDAVDEEEAETLVAKQLEDRVEWDDRIQPYFVSNGCEYQGMPDDGDCVHPAEKASTELLLVCPDCGAKCSGTAISDDDGLCYDGQCPLHVFAGTLPAQGS